MKYISKKSALWLLLLFVAVIVGCVNAILITVNNGDDYSLHKVRLHTLNVWSGEEYARFEVDDGGHRLWFSSWLVIWSNVHDPYDHFDNISGVFVGGGSGHELWSRWFQWIWWWYHNATNVAIDGDIGVIWWWAENQLLKWVILWWYNNKIPNTSARNSVILWWNSSECKAANCVIIWWSKNSAGESSLAFWSGAETENNSFSWNAVNNKERSARIDASGWVLIGTYTGIDGINLVVNGAVKLDSRSFTWVGVKGEIAVVSWCVYAYNGSDWYSVSKWDGCSSGLPVWSCQFGNVILLNGDIIENGGYSEPYDEDCDSKKWDVKCENGNLDWSYIYPYCYKLS